MKKIFLILFLLPALLMYPQGLSRYYKYVVIMGDDKSASEKLADTYLARVTADGGTVTDFDKVVTAYETALTNLTYTDCILWVSPDFGVKKNANNKVTKLYNLIGTNDPAQTDTSLAGTWTTSGLKVDATNDYYVFTAINLDNMNIYFVHNFTTTSLNNTPLGDNGAWVNTYQIPSATSFRFIAGGVDIGINVTQFDRSKTNLYYIENNSNTVSVGVNGTIAGTTATNAGVFVPYRLFGSNGRCRGLFYEMKISDVAPDVSTRQAEETYFNTKYTIY